MCMRESVCFALHVVYMYKRGGPSQQHPACHEPLRLRGVHAVGIPRCSRLGRPITRAGSFPLQASRDASGLGRLGSRGFCGHGFCEDPSPLGAPKRPRSH